MSDETNRAKDILGIINKHRITSLLLDVRKTIVGMRDHTKPSRDIPAP